MKKQSKKPLIILIFSFIITLSPSTQTSAGTNNLGMLAATIPFFAIVITTAGVSFFAKDKWEENAGVKEDSINSSNILVIPRRAKREEETPSATLLAKYSIRRSLTSVRDDIK